MNLRQKWMTFAPLGLLLTGMGATVTAWAATEKSNGRSWFWPGTLGLCLLNAGISVFGEAVKAATLVTLTAED